MLGVPQDPGRADQHQLPLRRGRARATCSTTPTWSPASTTRSTRRRVAAVGRPLPEAHDVRARSRTAPAPTPARSARSAFDEARRRGVARARLRRALRRRHLHHLHRRHHRHAQGRDVAPRGHLLRARPAASTPSPASGSTRRVPAAPRRPRRADRPLVFCVIPPLMHGAAQWATLSQWFQGSTVVLVREVRRGRGVWRPGRREHGVNSVIITGDAMARPLIEALEDDPGRWDLVVAHLAVVERRALLASR